MSTINTNQIRMMQRLTAAMPDNEELIITHKSISNNVLLYWGDAKFVIFPTGNWHMYRRHTGERLREGKYKPEFAGKEKKC